MYSVIFVGVKLHCCNGPKLGYAFLPLKKKKKCGFYGSGEPSSRTGVGSWWGWGEEGGMNVDVRTDVHT